MDIGSLIKSRRSTFTSQFSGEKIEDHHIWEMLENANWAPNHYHTEPWRFQVFANAGLERLLSKLGELYQKNAGDSFSPAKLEKYAARVNQVSHVIVLILNKSNRPKLPEIEEVEAVACAIQNLWLTVASKPGIGGYWSTGALSYLPEFADFLGLQDNQTCLGLFYLGVLKPDAIEPIGKRGSIAEKVVWVNE